MLALGLWQPIPQSALVQGQLKKTHLSQAVAATALSAPPSSIREGAVPERLDSGSRKHDRSSGRPPQGEHPTWDTPAAIGFGASLTHAHGHKVWRILFFRQVPGPLAKTPACQGPRAAGTCKVKPPLMPKGNTAVHSEGTGRHQ